MDKLDNLINIFRKYKELSIVLLILSVISMIIIPIPHQVMDVLIGINIGFTIIVLMVVIYMESPLELTSFPSILLVLALFRIGITISSSRLILLDADAGQIISTFGEFVVGGNLVVGTIIFCIITLINFIVITKGSERVAEVSARFSLDAMPGKQMSIDSDLRAGNIDMNEAQRRRNRLGLESKLFGAMDGAMKFVKGDAIASIIDIVINIVGGLIVGMMQHNLSFGNALSTYSILTIGDGLVQQIPALMVSLTAGLMITRVSDDDNPEKENLGNNIIRQVFNRPKTLISASILFVFMGLIPGMPSGVFGVLFIIIIAIAFYLKKNGGNQSSTSSSSDTLVEKNSDASDDNTLVRWKVQPIVLDISYHLRDSNYSKMIKKSLVEIRKDLLLRLGVQVPQIILNYNKDLESDKYELNIFEVPVAKATLRYNKILLLEDSNEFLKALHIKDTIKNDIDLGIPEYGTWVDEGLKPQCEEHGLRYLTLEQFIKHHLSKIICQNVSEFLGMQEVKELLDHANEYQDLIKEVLRMLPLNKITDILQRLVLEGISIRNFKVILDTMLEWGTRETEVVIITEYIRQALGRYIAHRYSNGTGVIPCFFLDAEIEDMVRDSIRFNDKGSYLSIDPSQVDLILSQIYEQFSNVKDLKVTPVIVTQMDIRRYVRSILEKKYPYINVLSFQEVESFVSFNGLGLIEL